MPARHTTKASEPTGPSVETAGARPADSAMRGSSTIELGRFRIVDLTIEVTPSERRIDGRYTHGDHLWGRPFEVDEYIAYEARMHLMTAHTHGGTHTEAPYKYLEDGLDLGAMPLTSYIGEAVVCDFSSTKAGAVISPLDLEREGVQEDDIVLCWSNAETVDDWPHLSLDSINWLIQRKVKLVACENVRHSPPGTPFGATDGDGQLLRAGIAIVDGIVGLGRLR